MSVDVYSDLSYQLLASFGWIIYHGVEGSKFNVVDENDLITRPVRRGLYKEKRCFSTSVDEAVKLFWCRN